jgi:S1-C subfamily serine protease
LGLTLSPIPTSHPHYEKLKGVSVVAVDPGSAASDAGIRAGDIIFSAGHVVVTRPDDLAQIIRARQKGVPLLLQILRGEFLIFVAIG